MSILDVAPIGGGEETDLVATGQLAQVVVKITRLLQIVQHTQQTGLPFREEGGHGQSSCRPSQSAQIQVPYRFLPKGLLQSCHPGMGGKLFQ